MRVASYTDSKGFGWLTLVGENTDGLGSNIVLGPIWSDYISDEQLCKKVQNILVKYKAYDMNTFLAQVHNITREINDRNIMRLIRHGFAEELM